MRVPDPLDASAENFLSSSSWCLNQSISPFGPAAEGETYPLMTADGRLKVPEIYLRNNDLAFVFAYQPPPAAARPPSSGRTARLPRP
jgi:hypothetical protein